MASNPASRGISARLRPATSNRGASLENGKFPKLHGKSIRYLMICAVGVLIFVSLGIYPRQKSIDKLDIQIQRLKNQIETQKVLLPIFKTLVKKAKIKDPADLPLPKQEKLDRAKAVVVSDTFRGMARMSNLQPVDIAPDLKDLAKDSKFLSVNVHLIGDFFNFRDFLIRLADIPYVEHIEKVQIQPGVGIREYHLRLWLALET